MRRFLPLFLLVLVACGTETVPSTTTEAVELVTTGSTQSTEGTVPDQTDTTSVPPPTDTTSPATTTTVDPNAPFVIEVVFAGGSVQGGGRIQVARGQSVVVRVTSDVTEEIHVHGYDVFLDLEPGVAGELEFVADIPGVFEVELEKSRLEIIELEVGA